MSQETSYAAMLSVRLSPGNCLPVCDPAKEQTAEELSLNLREALDLPLPSGEKGELMAEAIQEQALDILRRRMHEAGITPDQRIVLTLDAGGHIHAAEHPDRERLEDLARKEPLPRLFRQIAAISLTGRGLDDLRLAHGLLQGNEGAEPLLQACLKGALSHFHLVRP